MRVSMRICELYQLYFILYSLYSLLNTNIRIGTEQKFWKRGFRVLIGVDEVGRGALAGPVVAAACSVSNLRAFCRSSESRELLRLVNDSKKLSPRRRETAFRLLSASPYIRIAVSSVGPQRIDRLNIRRAALLAMRNASLRLISRFPNYPLTKSVLLIDGIEYPFASSGKRCKNRRIPHQYTYIGGDSSVFLIAAASIIAKVTRDRLMTRLGSRKYPKWAFETHKGYATRLHTRLIKRHGLSPIHRRTFIRGYQLDFC